MTITKDATFVTSERWNPKNCANHLQKDKEKETDKWETEKKQIINGRLGSNISIILNANSLNALIKRHRLL